MTIYEYNKIFGLLKEAQKKTIERDKLLGRFYETIVYQLIKENNTLKQKLLEVTKND